MKLSDILGYEIDVAGHGALRSMQRILADGPINLIFLSALLPVQDRPRRDQTMLGMPQIGRS